MPLSLVYMHIVPKRKDGLAIPFVILNLQILMKLGSLLFYKQFKNKLRLKNYHKMYFNFLHKDAYTVQ